LYIAQQLAAQAVSQVFAGRNLTATLDAIFREHTSITPQQRAVTQDLSYGTLRFYGQLQALLAQLLERPLQDDWLRCLLLVAIYQLTHDKAAPHTVVDQAVKAATQLKKSWAKGLVNAVLRNFLRRQTELMQKIVANEVAVYSYPQWWINKLKTQYPQQWQAMLEAGNQHPPMTLRVNRRHSNSTDYCRKLVDQGLEARPIGDYAVALAKPVPVDKIPGFSEGEVSVQDYGAQFAAALLDVSDGLRVLDACCAPGGKTGHILELADVNLVAMDSDNQRLQRTRSNLDRLKLEADLVTGDAADPKDWWDGVPFDRILADVPCTASGIVRRHVDIKWLRREADIASFTAQQAVILRGLWQLLAKGGKLLYATCSIFHEENQRQIEKFLEGQADAVQLPLSDLHNALPQHGQLLPCAEHDGFFYALLQKN
jgi:16S rRNA (cytosine967-C5)-methyltransferase